MSVDQQQALEQARRQLEVAFGYALDGEPRPWIHVTTSRDFAGTWFDSIDDAGAFIERERDRTDVYVGVGLRRVRPANGRGGRGVECLDGIVGFLGDFDVKPGAFTTIEDARLFAWSVLPTPPSMLVQSGGGLQAWWLLSEPWFFEYPAERDKAATFARQFGATLKAAGAAKGIKVDSTHDLARVFRVAGTWNRKIENNPRPTMLELPAEGTTVRRYELDDLEVGLIAEESVPKDPDKALPSMGFVTLATDRSPPADALQALLVNHEKARGSWEGKRPDLADQSPSSLDFSLATIAVGMGWNDQDVADLLVAGRRHRGDDLKTGKGGALRLDYYQRTIARAKSLVATEKAERAKSRPRSSDGDSGSESRAIQTADDARRVTLEVWGVEILRVEKAGTGTDRARYTIILAGERRVEIGTAASMLDQRRMQAALFEARIVVGQLRAADWKDVRVALNLLVEEVAPDDDEKSETARWIVEFLGDHGCFEQPATATPLFLKLRQKPDWFFHKGRYAIELSRLRLDLPTKYGEPISARALGQRLRNLGFELTRLSARHETAQCRRFYWLSPEGWDPFAAGESGARKVEEGPNP